MYDHIATHKSSFQHFFNIQIYNDNMNIILLDNETSLLFQKLQSTSYPRRCFPGMPDEGNLDHVRPRCGVTSPDRI